MKFKKALKKFAYETFRPHSFEEYAEVFTRGRESGTQSADGAQVVYNKTPYPWLYSRVFLFSLLLFTFLCVGYSATGLNFPTVAAAGGIFADLTFIVLLYETYPKRDIPLILPIALLFAGGLLSTAISDFFYGIDRFFAPYVHQAWTAFVEETSKALVTILFLLIFKKKRDPMFCFIVGAAVGGGYSAFENIWYMYTDGFAYSASQGLSRAMQTGLWRALGTPFSHAAWAALFGWALSGKAPWKKWQPYALFAFNYTMHFFVNFPLMAAFANWNGYAISATTGVITIALLIFIWVRVLQGYADKSEEEEPRQIHYFPTNAARRSFTANVFAAAAIFALCFAFLGPTCVFGGYTYYKTLSFESWQDCLNYTQCGLTFEPQRLREFVQYDDLSQNYSYTWEEGELRSAVQREQYGEYFYRYYYSYVTYSVYIEEDGEMYAGIWYGEDAFGIIEGFDFDKADLVYDDDGVVTEAKIWEQRGIALEYEEALYAMCTLTPVYVGGEGLIYADESGYPVLYYFIINPNASRIYGMPGGTFEMDIRENVPIRKVESIVFTAVWSAASLGCGIAYIIFKKKRKDRQDEGQLLIL